MIDESIRVLAGDCTVIAEGTDREEYRGRVTTIVKPDNTVLVHDVDGYQPVAWLTRADSVSSDRANDFALVAKKDEQTLRIATHDQDGFGHYPGSAAGTPVGTCPDCDGALVRSRGVHCVDCGTRYGVPTDATIHADGNRCDCGLPRMRVERGLAFNVCLDRECESLDEAVQTAFDRAWDCPEPDCDGDLRILRRGGLLAGCECYPDCDVGFVIPTGVVDGECACGLPAFDTSTGRRCLDATCDRYGHGHVNGHGNENPDRTAEDDATTDRKSSSSATTDPTADGATDAPPVARPDAPADSESTSELETPTE